MKEVEEKGFVIPDEMECFIDQLEEACSALWNAVDDAKSLDEKGEFDLCDVDELDDVLCELQQLNDIVTRNIRKKKKKLQKVTAA